VVGAAPGEPQAGRTTVNPARSRARISRPAGSRCSCTRGPFNHGDQAARMVHGSAASGCSAAMRSSSSIISLLPSSSPKNILPQGVYEDYPVLSSGKPSGERLAIRRDPRGRGDRVGPDDCNIATPEATDLDSVTDAGVAASVNGRCVLAGNHACWLSPLSASAASQPGQCRWPDRAGWPPTRGWNRAWRHYRTQSTPNYGMVQRTHL